MNMEDEVFLYHTEQIRKPIEGGKTYEIEIEIEIAIRACRVNYGRYRRAMLGDNGRCINEY